MLLKVSRQDEIGLLRVAGKVGWENSRVLDRQVRQVIDHGARWLVFDLDQVDFLSSGAIGVLVYHLRRLQGGQGDVFVIARNEYVLYLFRTIGFHRLFQGKLFGSDAEFVAASERLLGRPFATPAEPDFACIDSRFDDDDELSQREEQP